jgi:hypothetical protein
VATKAHGPPLTHASTPACGSCTGILSFGIPDDRNTAVESLKNSRKKAFFQAARLAKNDLDPSTRQIISGILQHRGQPPL